MNRLLVYINVSYLQLGFLNDLNNLITLTYEASFAMAQMMV